MTVPSDLWPPTGLMVRSGDLTMTPISDADLPGLVDLALAGVHAPGYMPFETPWTTASAEDLPRRYAAHYWSTRAAFSAETADVDFAVRHTGELVGVQGFSARDFAVTRTAETGSWLGRRFQGGGLGTRMRRAICTLLFDHLGATEITSGAFLDNPASLAVSRKLGYRPNGVVRKARQGQSARNQRLVLTPEAFVRGETVVVIGVEPLRAHFELG